MQDRIPNPASKALQMVRCGEHYEEAVRSVDGLILAGELGGAGTEDCLKLNIYVPSGVQKGDECE